MIIESGIQSIAYKEQSIRAQRMQSGPRQAVCIFREDWPKVEQAAAALSQKTEDWLSTRDITKLPGGSSSDIKEAVKAIIEDYDSLESGIQSIAYKKQSIRAQRMQCSGFQAVCIFREDWPKVEQAAGGRLLEKTEDWLSSEDTRKLPGGSSSNMKQAVKSIMEHYDSSESGIQSIVYNEQSIRVQKMQSGNIQTTCICLEDWPKVEQAAGGRLLEKTEDWLSPKDIEKLPGSKRSNIIQAVKSIMERYDRTELGIQSITYKEQSIRAQRMQSATRQAVYIFREDWSKVEQAAGVRQAAGVKLPTKTEDWLSPLDIRKLPGGNRSNIKQAVKVVMEHYDSLESGIQSVAYNEQTIRAQLMQSGTREAVCIYREDLLKVEQAAEVESISGRTSLKSAAITPKALTPGSEHLKRSGRTPEV